MFELHSTCDDAGALLAARLNDPTFTRTVSRHPTEAEAVEARRRYLVDHPDIGEGCLTVRRAEPRNPPQQPPTGTVWFVSFDGDKRGLGRWSGPHGDKAEADAEAGRLSRLGYEPQVWSETDEQRGDANRRLNAALDRHQAKLQRIRAVTAGARIGEGMAAHAVTEGDPPTWPGFDPVDCATLFDCGIKPESDAWNIAERSARLAFDRVIGEHDNRRGTVDAESTEGTNAATPQARVAEFGDGRRR